MTNGSAKWLLGGYSDSGDVSGNSVNVSGGTLSGGVNGGETTSGNATGNSVDFSNVTATYVQGGYSGSGSATGNSLALHSGTVQKMPSAAMWTAAAERLRTTASPSMAAA